MVKVKQRFERPLIKNVEQELIRKIHEKDVLSKIKQNQSIAIAVGSRGITDLPLMVKTL